jgi:CRP/FNR family transcriptional regulator, cyclic AMP receptor protein
MTAAPQASRPVSVVAEDSELAERLAPEHREPARRQLMVSVIALATGVWTTPATFHEPDALGLLVLDGVLVRSVGRASRLGAELLGPGDLVRPWQHDGDGGVLAFETSWSVVSPARLAVLDGAFSQRLGAFPELFEGLVGRVLQRARGLAVTMAIAQEPTVEARLELMLWHLADRYGRVRPDGVIIPLGLTHTVLARLVAARRPSTTTALGRLVARGALERDPDGWLLRGEPPTPGKDGTPVRVRRA